jgi:hypothetical protein
MIKWCGSLFVILLLTGCTTFNVKDREAGIYKIIDFINNGESEKLVTSSRIPFLYDGEIILLQKDIRLIWNTLSESNFSIKDPEITAMDNIDEQTYTVFTTSMEGKVFFKRHLPKKTVITTVSAKNGTYYFLTGGDKKSGVTIFGMKGPVQ